MKPEAAALLAAVALAPGAFTAPALTEGGPVPPKDWPCRCPYSCLRHKAERLARAAAKREAKRLRRAARAGGVR